MTPVEFRRHLHRHPELSFRETESARFIAEALREAGIRTQIHAEQKKFKQKISYADKLSIPYAVFLGEDEISSGVCAVKDLQSGEQVKLSPAEAVSHIQAGLDKLNQGKPILDKGE